MIFKNYETKLIHHIQLPQSAYEEAVKRYQSVGTFLASDLSPLKHTSPEIRPQGSFRLGTAIYPQSKNKEFDLDLTMICGLYTPDNCTQKDFKELAKRTVQVYADQHGMKKIEEKRRCVRLNYKSSNVNDSSFHIDIVPAIHGTEYERNEIRSLQGLFDETSVFITDTNSPDFTKKHGRWLSSNPEGYALWFESCMKSEMELCKRSLLSADNPNIDDIPTWRVTTGLQASVQLLKWHRDCMFDKNPDVKPVSIIITTLAGKAYKNNPQTISDMLHEMEHLLNEMNWTVKNPVDPREDFTDKWKEPSHRDDHLRDHFSLWLRKAYADFSALENDKLSTSDAESLLRRAFNYCEAPNTTPSKPEVIIRKPVSKPYGY